MNPTGNPVHALNWSQKTNSIQLQPLKSHRISTVGMTAWLDTEDPRVLLQKCHRNAPGLSLAPQWNCCTVSSQALHFGALWRDSSPSYTKHSRTGCVGNSGVRREAGQCSGTGHFWSLGTESHPTAMWSCVSVEMSGVQVTFPECSKVHWTAVVTGALCSSNRVTSEAEWWVSQVFTSLQHLLLSH